MKSSCFLSLLFLGLNYEYANDSAKLNKFVFSPAIGYNLVGETTGALGQVSVSRFIFKNVSIGLNAQLMNYWGKPMVPLTFELMRRPQNTLRTAFIAVAQGGALFWNRTAAVKTWSGQNVSERHSGKYTWAAGGGVQFKSKSRSAFYTLAKLQMYQIRHEASVTNASEPFYVDNNYSAAIQLVVGVNVL